MPTKSKAQEKFAKKIKIPVQYQVKVKKEMVKPAKNKK